MPRLQSLRLQPQRYMWLLCSCANSHAQRIAWVQHQFGLRTYKRRSRDTWIHFAIPYLHAAFKYAAHNAFLLPGLPFANLAIGIKARQLGAGAGTAGRTIISLSGTQHEILAVDSGNLRWSKQLDMVNLFAIRANDALVTKSL